MSQDDKILQHLEAGNTITPAEAYAIAGTLALHSAISRLRKRCYRIDMQMRHDNGKHFGEYWIAVPYG